MMPKLIWVTSDPGGGKTTLIETLHGDAGWCEYIVALPEAISLVCHCGIILRLPPKSESTGILAQTKQVRNEVLSLHRANQ
jgi:hypothetical protein